MRQIYSIICALCLLIAGACTQYNGHIGPIFGAWSLIEISEDGSPLQLDDETTFSFQNEIVRVVRLDNPPYEKTERYGNFTLVDNVLTLKFAASPTPSGSHLYMAPEWVNFPEGESTVTLDVRKLNGSKMELLLHSDGKTYVYSFRKTW